MGQLSCTHGAACSGPPNTVSITNFFTDAWYRQLRKTARAGMHFRAGNGLLRAHLYTPFRGLLVSVRTSGRHTPPPPRTARALGRIAPGGSRCCPALLPCCKAQIVSKLSGSKPCLMSESIEIMVEAETSALAVAKAIQQLQPTHLVPRSF